jgi:hypothetical protein
LHQAVRGGMLGHAFRHYFGDVWRGLKDRLLD